MTQNQTKVISHPIWKCLLPNFFLDKKTKTGPTTTQFYVSVIVIWSQFNKIYYTSYLDLFAYNHAVAISDYFVVSSEKCVHFRNESEGYRINKPLSGLLICQMIMPSA